MRIGLIADTHDELVDWAGVLDRVTRPFDGVEMILHCGDLTTMRALEDLDAIAPTVAVRSGDDPPAAPPKLLDGPHVVAAEGVTIGLVNRLDDASPAALFDRPIDVVVHGGTHEATTETRDGVLLVNPGSPSLATTCTVAVLDLAGAVPAATIVPI